jgi:hypothetical protein
MVEVFDPASTRAKAVHNIVLILCCDGLNKEVSIWNSPLWKIQIWKMRLREWILMETEDGEIIKG